MTGAVVAPLAISSWVTLQHQSISILLVNYYHNVTIKINNPGNNGPLKAESQCKAKCLMTNQVKLVKTTTGNKISLNQANKCQITICLS